MASGLAVATLVLACTFAAVAARDCYKCDSFSDIFRLACFYPMKYYVDTISCRDSYSCTHVSYYTASQHVVSRGCGYEVDACTGILTHLKVLHSVISNFTCNTCYDSKCNNASDVAL